MFYDLRDGEPPFGPPTGILSFRTSRWRPHWSGCGRLVQVYCGTRTFRLARPQIRHDAGSSRAAPIPAIRSANLRRFPDDRAVSDRETSRSHQGFRSPDPAGEEGIQGTKACRLFQTTPVRLKRFSLNLNHLTLPEIKYFNALGDSRCPKLNANRSNVPLPPFRVRLCQFSALSSSPPLPASLWRDRGRLSVRSTALA